MKSATLRHRLQGLLLRWSLLFLVVFVAVVLFPLARLRGVHEQDRLQLSRSLSRVLDTSLADLFLHLQGFASEIDELDETTLTRMRSLRFRSPFHAAVYILDHQGRLVLSDPGAVEPLPPELLRGRESVTDLFPSSEGPGRVAIVQPFDLRRQRYYLVAEMDPRGGAFSELLRDFFESSEPRAFVVDSKGTVIAASESRYLFQVQLEPESLGRRILNHSSLQVDEVRCGPCEAAGPEGDGDLLVMAMAPCKLAPWGVMILERKPAWLSAPGIGYALLGSVVIFVGMGFLLSMALSSSVVNPIQALSRQAEALRRGELDRPIEVRGDHEVEVLGQTLDQARRELAAGLDELRALNEGLEEQVEERTAEIEKLLHAALEQDAQRRNLVRRLMGAGEEERRRIARELHDETSQLLTAVQLLLRDLPGRTEQVTKASALLARTQKEIHRIIYDLRPSLLDDLGLSAAVRWYATNYLAPNKVQVNLEISPKLRIPADLEIAVFRIYQEIVTNILRHSKAEHVSVELYIDKGNLVLAVEDDGVGFDEADGAGGVGIIGMRERADLVNGTVRIDSDPGMGTYVMLKVPLDS